VIYCSQETARVMKEGSIINVVSIAGIKLFVGLSMYRAAVINLTQALALELAPRMNAVPPAWRRRRLATVSLA